MKNTKIDFCPLPWYGMFIGYKGKYMPCCMNHTSIGDIEKSNMDDVWNNKTFRRIRNLIKENKYDEAGCDKNCFVIHELKQNRKIDLFDESWLMVDNKDFLSNLELLEKSILYEGDIALNKPVMFDLQPTEQCNMKCIMCNQNHTNAVHISKKNIKKIFKFPEYLYTIRFQGGEIFVKNEYKELLNELKEISLPFQEIQVITNGSLLSHEEIDEMLHVKFIVSADGTTEETYNMIRRSPHFKTVMSNIKYLAKHQKKLGVKNLVQWTFVVMKSNFYQIKEALKIASELEIQINFQPIMGNYEEENIFMYKTLFNQQSAVSYLDSILKTQYLNKLNIEQIQMLKERLLNEN